MYAEQPRRSHHAPRDKAKTTPSQRTAEGATAAARIGISAEAYRERRQAGLLWCSTHRDWHPKADFPIDKSRTTGHTARCREALQNVTATRAPQRAVARKRS